MSVDKKHRNERRVYGPNVILCEVCEGHGTLLRQNDTNPPPHRAVVVCEVCRETGLKGIPESEVNRVRAK
jgi:hypothetical protein